MFKALRNIQVFIQFIKELWKVYHSLPYKYAEIEVQYAFQNHALFVWIDHIPSDISVQWKLSFSGISRLIFEPDIIPHNQLTGDALITFVKGIEDVDDPDNNAGLR